MDWSKLIAKKSLQEQDCIFKLAEADNYVDSFFVFVGIVYTVATLPLLAKRS